MFIGRRPQRWISNLPGGRRNKKLTTHCARQEPDKESGGKKGKQKTTTSCARQEKSDEHRGWRENDSASIFLRCSEIKVLSESERTPIFSPSMVLSTVTILSVIKTKTTYVFNVICPTRCCDSRASSLSFAGASLHKNPECV